MIIHIIMSDSMPFFYLQKNVKMITEISNA